MGQESTVVTVDQALYHKIMELKRAKSECYEKVIPRLGGLHIQMTFERVIGQHMQDAGLYDILIECKIIGPGVAEQVFSGKKHKKAMQCHKLTFQALWRVILPQFQQHVMANNANIYKTFSTVLSMIWMTY